MVVSPRSFVVFSALGVSRLPDGSPVGVRW